MWLREIALIKFIIYSRKNCCLCEQMLEQLMEYDRHQEFQIEQVDIDSDDQLIELYAGRIPVLAAGDLVLCEYYFQSQVLDDYLAQLAQTN